MRRSTPPRTSSGRPSPPSGRFGVGADSATEFTDADGNLWLQPATLPQLLQQKAAHPAAVVVSGYAGFLRVIRARTAAKKAVTTTTVVDADEADAAAGNKKKGQVRVYIGAHGEGSDTPRPGATTPMRGTPAHASPRDEDGMATPVEFSEVTGGVKPRLSEGNLASLGAGGRRDSRVLAFDVRSVDRATFSELSVISHEYSDASVRCVPVGARRNPVPPARVGNLKRSKVSTIVWQCRHALLCTAQEAVHKTTTRHPASPR